MKEFEEAYLAHKKLCLDLWEEASILYQLVPDKVHLPIDMSSWRAGTNYYDENAMARRKAELKVDEAEKLQQSLEYNLESARLTFISDNRSDIEFYKFRM